MKKKIGFKEVIQFAEEYIENNAGECIACIRKLNKKYNCKELIKNTYKPVCTIKDIENSNEWKYILLKRFCIELQNYRHMTNAIGYERYSYKNQYNKDENRIFNIAKNFLDNKNINDNVLLKVFEKELNITKNPSWERYSKGLTDAINFINGLDRKTFVKTLEQINKYNDRSALKSIYKSIYYMGEALAYDFVKELGCTNVVKPDIHIKDLAKLLLGVKNQIPQTVIKFCKENGIDPYYADKILWLCCTGNFYEDGITIHRMNKKNFIEYCKHRFYSEEM